MQVDTILERMLFTTVRITTTTPTGGGGLGTGFVFTAPMPALGGGKGGGKGGVAMVLVTNKHVVHGQARAVLHFIAADETTASPNLGAEISVGVDPASFVGHPDPNIDVAILPLGGLIDQLRAAGRTPFFTHVDAASAATPEVLAEYEPIEPITFIGYPNGLYDSGSLLPIARRGHSATALNVDYEGKPIFLVDASVFPGSSGSPVFLFVPASTADKFGNITLGGGAKVVFLGVVAAVYQRAVPVLQTPTAGDQFVHDALDIGIVYKASTVVELVNQVITQQGEGSA
ncbi:trypsin-like peptidase domain-containing protein [Phycicoccus sp. BSK3Z-2]|uniref:Trypsin-like peptidase domain-containing protein n=1 Tax=Phycicoccus avicenniae TaxID=2828860 RepID=A0A941I0H8_9MICO|nr:trypsin-like peptidase domain-containing protein [Phycicoccus avicenniae]MBR7743134.1 trypsin-like peptidase domain-containing protein [Phycicoccus avicenniae]